MPIGKKVLSLEKKIQGLMRHLGAKREPLEIYRAVLDDVVDHVEPAGRGQRVFPYDLVNVFVVVPRERRAAVRTLFDEAPALAERIRTRLREIGCDAPGELAARLHFVNGPRPDWAPEADFHVHYKRRPKATRAPRRRGGASEADGVPGATAANAEPVAKLEAPARLEGREPGREASLSPADGTASIPAVRLVVMDGKAKRRATTLRQPRIDLGRTEQIVDKDGRVTRHNHLVFLDTEGEVNRSVSRSHAHITHRSGSTEFRLHDDRSTHGTRILRDARVIDVPPQGSLGVLLRHGDEICLGRARVRFLLGEASDEVGR